MFILVDYKHKDFFWKPHVDKQLKIAAEDGTFVANNPDIHWEDFELSESLCSESELRFGSCEPSSIKFQIRNAFLPLEGKWLKVSETLDGENDEPITYGRYKVFSDTMTADREYRDIVAYDSMYDLLEADVSDWYNTILPNKDSKVTMKEFRSSFASHFSLEEVDPVMNYGSEQPIYGLPNDSMSIEKTIDPEQLSGKDVITAICEINGCFGHIGRDGKLHYIYLPQAIEGLYPANDLFPDHAPDHMAQAKTGHLYPQDPNSTRITNGSYIKCQYEDYTSKPITKLQIRKEENDIGKTWPEGDITEKDNCYIIQDNFLVYGKPPEQLSVIAENILGKITDVSYRPFSAEVVGNPCFEVGDPVRFLTKYDIVESYVLKRTLKGIQAPIDSFQAHGVKKYSEKLNSVRRSIIQLKGKANILTRTLEETKLEMYDIEEGLYNTITVTAKDIRAELKNEVDELNTTISITAGQIRTELSDTKNNLQSQITQNAGEIALRVRKDNVIASINLSPESITLEAQRIDLKGLVNADELVSKFATISTLNATAANLENLIATKATITDLNATNATVNSLSVEKLSVSEFNVEKASLESLIAKKIDATTVKADYMEVVNWTSAGKIRADRIDVDSIFSRASSSTSMRVGVLQTDFLDINRELVVYGNTASVQYIPSLGRTILVFD